MVASNRTTIQLMNEVYVLTIASIFTAVEMLFDYVTKSITNITIKIMQAGNIDLDFKQPSLK